jgi:hypothetical protein
MTGPPLRLPAALKLAVLDRDVAALRRHVAAGEAPPLELVDSVLERVAEVAGRRPELASALERFDSEPWKVRQALLEHAGMPPELAERTVERWESGEDEREAYWRTWHDYWRSRLGIERIRDWCWRRGYLLQGPVQLGERPRDDWCAFVVARGPSVPSPGPYGWGGSALEAAESLRDRLAASERK